METMKKKYYRIYNKLTKKYVTLENGSFVVMQYPIQCEKWIEKYYNNSTVYKIVEFKKG